jgi:O-antigen ligase
MGRMLNSEVPYQSGNRPASLAPKPLRAALPTQQRLNTTLAAAVPANRTGDAAQGGFRALAFRAGLGMLFVRLAILPEILVALLHVNTYLLYLVGPPAIAGAIVTGAVGRTFRSRAAWMWLGFFVCMFLSLPFSSWLGGSIGGFKNYALFSFPMLFIVGGLTAKWSDVRATFTTIGVAGLVVIAAAGLLAKADGEGRLAMADTSGTIGNSNDLASHFILVLPFILFIGMDKRRAAVLRWFLIVPAAYALKMILGTGSRGALVSLFFMFLFVIFRASAKQRLVAIVLAGLMAVSLPILIRGNALERLSTLFGDTGTGTVTADSEGLHEEAKESKEARSYLLKQSLLSTLKHPVFGVGMGQFSNYVGKLAQAEGKFGIWNETHNAFTEVSSELGVPAVLFFVLGIAHAFRSVSRIYRRARREGYTEITDASFCYLLAMVGYVVSIVFLANAYRFYLPVMIGLAIALSANAEREMAAGRVAEPVRTNGWASPVAARGRLARA